jgi:ABC-type transport system involved in multi-copper enzyme maturation permease subunit
VLEERQFDIFQNYRPPNRFEGPPPLADLQWNRTAPFYHWLIDLYFFILVPLNCVRMCGALIRDVLDADTLGFLTTRPLSRSRLLCVKYIAQIGWLQIWLFIQTLLLFAAGALKQIPDLATLLPLFFGAQFLAILAWGALGLFLGLVSKKYMALALVYGSIVEMGIGRIPTNINTLSLMRHLKALLGHNPALESIYNWPATGFLGPAGALLLGALFFLFLAALMFTYREYHHTTEMQK